MPLNETQVTNKNRHSVMLLDGTSLNACLLLERVIMLIEIPPFGPLTLLPCSTPPV